LHLVNQLFPSDRDTEFEIPLCSPYEATYAKFVLDDSEDTLTSEVFRTDDGYFTKTFKIDPGTYNLTFFALYDANDEMVKAAPLPGSEFYQYVEVGLPVEFVVPDFKKVQVDIDVLCYEPNVWEAFGFYWFNINEITVREFCFFGDFCIKHTEDYLGSWYELTDGGVFMDEPAIFELQLYRNGELVGTYQNFDPQTEEMESPLCVKYADDDDEVDHFTLNLSLYAAIGEDFGFTSIGSFEWDDIFEDTYNVGEDGVLDFVVGNCLDDADVVFPPYMNLPSGTFEMVLLPTYGPGLNGTYIDVDFTGIGTGYDISDGIWGAWCGDSETGISVGVSYTVNALSSLGPLPSGFRLSRLQVDLLNYFFNKLPELATYNGTFDYDDPSPYWADIQEVIWAVTNGSGTSGNATTMYDYVMANGYEGYTPLPGGWAAVLLDAGERTQLLFITVDP